MLRKHTVQMLMLCLFWAAAQSGSGQAPAAGPKPKDQAEYDLIVSVQKETDPTKKLALLDQWKQKYPETELKEMRLKTYMDTYRLANQPAKAIEAAKEVLALMPNDF